MPRAKKSAAAVVSAEPIESKVNKSEAIRVARKALGRGAKAKAIIANLAEQGINVTAAAVYAVLGKSKRRRLQAAAPKSFSGGRGRPSSNGEALNVDALLAVNKISQQVGGLDHVEAATRALRKLQLS